MNTGAMQKTGNKSLNKFGCLGLTVSVILFTAAFIFGAFSGSEDRVSVIQAVEKIVKIFSFNSRIWYYYISAFAQGITYIIIMILLIKSSVVSLKYLTAAKGNHAPKVVTIGSEFSEAYRRCVIYVFISCMLNQTTFSTTSSIFLMVGWLIVVTSEVLGSVSQNNEISWKYLVSDTIYSLVKGIVLAIFGYYVARPVVLGFVEGIRILFTAVDFSSGWAAMELVYRTLLIEIIYILLIFDFFALINKELFYTTAHQKESWTHLIVISSVYVALEIFMLIALSSSGGNTGLLGQLGNYFTILRNASLPLLLAPIAGRVACDFPEFSMIKQKKNVAIEKKQPIDKAVVETVNETVDEVLE